MQTIEAKKKGAAVGEGSAMVEQIIAKHKKTKKAYLQLPFQRERYRFYGSKRVANQWVFGSLHDRVYSQTQSEPWVLSVGCHLAASIALKHSDCGVSHAKYWGNIRDTIMCLPSLRGGFLLNGAFTGIVSFVNEMLVFTQ